MVNWYTQVTFNWNENLAEQIRCASEKAMQGQVSEMEGMAARMEQLARQRMAEAERIRSRIPVMMRVPLPAKEGEEPGYEMQEDVAESNRLRQEASAMEAQANEARRGAAELRREAERLKDAIRATNRQFENLFNMAQSEDRRTAWEMQQILDRIEQYIKYKESIRNSFNPGGLSSTGTHERRDKTKSLIVSSHCFESVWSSMESLLARNADDISPFQFAGLAQVFTGMTELADQERFLNILADPVPTANTYFIPSHPERFNGDTLYTVCPLKIGGLLGVLDLGIVAALAGQIYLLTEGGRGNGDPVFDAMEDFRHAKQNRYSLLREVFFAQHGLLDQFGQPVTNKVFVGNGGNGPFSLSTLYSNEIDGFQLGAPAAMGATLTAQSAFRHEHEGLGGTEISIQSPNTWHISVSNTLLSSATSSAVVNFATEQALSNNQFSSVSYLMSSGQMKALGAAIAAAFPAVGGSKLITTALSTGISMISASNKAGSLSNEILDLRDSARFGYYNTHLRLESTIILGNHQQQPRMVHWPSPYSYLALQAFNATTANRTERDTDQNAEWARRDAFPTVVVGVHPSVPVPFVNPYLSPFDRTPRPPNTSRWQAIEWEDFLRDPLIGFEMYRYLDLYDDDAFQRLRERLGLGG